jgi:hypothetical protein
MPADGGGLLVLGGRVVPGVDIEPELGCVVMRVAGIDPLVAGLPAPARGIAVERGGMAALPAANTP